MHEVMAAVARSRYHEMPDPVESADDSDKSLPPAIRFVDYGGDFDTYFEINVIGPYPDTAARDADLTRLRALPDPRGAAQFFPDRLGSIPADLVFEPARVAEATTMTGFLAAWDGCSEAEYLDDEPELCDELAGQLPIDADEAWRTAEKVGRRQQ